MRCAARRICWVYRSQSVPKAAECPSFAASTSHLSAGSEVRIPQSEPWCFRSKSLNFPRSFGPRPLQLVLALHYACPSLGTHHDMEWFLGTSLGVTPNTTFGWWGGDLTKRFPD